MEQFDSPVMLIDSFNNSHSLKLNVMFKKVILEKKHAIRFLSKS